MQRDRRKEAKVANRGSGERSNGSSTTKRKDERRNARTREEGRKNRCGTDRIGTKKRCDLYEKESKSAHERSRFEGGYKSRKGVGKGVRKGEI
jgi:hypothetical protein